MIKEHAWKWIDQNREQLTTISDKIWEYAEYGLCEEKSSKLIAETLNKHGFAVQHGVAGMPTAILAEKGEGKPFHYFAFGMAVTEVLLDTLTGYHNILRTDILHDVGDSLNPAIDMGQIQGGYIQGVGWCTTEECKWDEKGNLLNHSPDTYKIPSVQDIPKDFRCKILGAIPIFFN